MSEIYYINLINLLNANPHSIEPIKAQYLLLLSELSLTTFIETELFIKNVERISEMGAIIVGIRYDISNNLEIIASGTILIEPKIIREGKSVGHIEDVVVAKHMRGKGICSTIIEILKTFAKKSNCYKVTLDCSMDVKKVYQKNGLEVNGVQMVEYFTR